MAPYGRFDCLSKPPLSVQIFRIWRSLDWNFHFKGLYKRLAAESPSFRIHRYHKTSIRSICLWLIFSEFRPTKQRLMYWPLDKFSADKRKTSNFGNPRQVSSIFKRVKPHSTNWTKIVGQTKGYLLNWKRRADYKLCKSILSKGKKK